ncbi:hypothetical protein [Kribbella catacumbae]|nr:hypothetical protein [Kribbella catacumbae]
MPKTPPPDGGKKKREQDNKALDKAHKGDNVEGSLRALRRLIGGKQ